MNKSGVTTEDQWYDETMRDEVNMRLRLGDNGAMTPEDESLLRMSKKIERLEDEVERLQAGGCARDQRTTQYCAEAVVAKREAAKWQEWGRKWAARATEAEAREDKLRAELDAALKESDALRCGVDKADIKVMRLCDILTDIVKQYDIATGEHCYTSAPVRYHIEQGRKELAKAY